MSSQLTLLGNGAYNALRWCFCNYCNRNVPVVRRRPSSQLLCPICRRPFIQELHFQTAPTNISFTYGFPTPAAILGGAVAPSLAIFSTPIPYAFSGDVHNIRMPFGFRSTTEAYLHSHYRPNLHTWIASFPGAMDYFQPPTILVHRNPNGAPPAARSVVEALPDEKITEETMANESSNECAVCKEKFMLNEETKRLPCNHIYHKNCILPWLERRNTCPICREELPTNDSDYENQRAMRQRLGSNNASVRMRRRQ